MRSGAFTVREKTSATVVTARIEPRQKRSLYGRDEWTFELSTKETLNSLRS